MILSYVTYGIFLALILWGAKFAGFGKKFNDDFVSLNVTKSLRGLAAIGVLLHHVSQQNAFRESGELVLFTEVGRYFVAIFIFCSGYGLVKSLKSKENYLNGFIKNRVVKSLVIPFYLSILIYAIYYAVFKIPLMTGQWIAGILGFGLLNGYAWFPIVLIILYLTFYFVYKNISKNRTRFIVIGIVIFALACVFCIEGHYPWIGAPENWWMTEEGWENMKWWMAPQFFIFSGEWWVNSNIAFLMGLMFAEYEEKIVLWLKQKYWLKFLASVVLFVGAIYLEQFVLGRFGYWTEFNMSGPGCFNKFMSFLGQTPSCIFFITTIFMLMMKLESQNPVTRFFGNISLDTYMMNFMAVNLLTFLIQKPNEEPILEKSNLVLFEIGVIAGSVLLGLVYRFIYKKICKLISGK